MDLRVDSSDAAVWLELRDLRPVDERLFRGTLRFSTPDGGSARPLWFDRDALDAFVREARWIERSTSGRATLEHAGRSDRLTLVRVADEWTIVVDTLDRSAPDGRTGVTVPVDARVAREVIARLAALAAFRTPTA